MSDPAVASDEGPGDLLFLCRANLIRSPLAAALLREQLAALGRQDLRVGSAGLQVQPGDVVGQEAYDAALEQGVDISHHRAVPVDGAMIAGAGLVVTMTEEQRAAAVRLSRVSVSHTFTLPELVRLLSAREGSAASTWADMARRAHAVRPFVEAVPEPEDVPDPVGRELSEHQVVAETVVRLTRGVVDHLAPELASRPG